MSVFGSSIKEIVTSMVSSIELRLYPYLVKIRFSESKGGEKEMDERKDKGGEIMATIYGPTTGIPFGLCSQCGDFTYHCQKCNKHPCPNCSPLVETPWGDTCPFCGDYMNVCHDPPDGMTREEWEKDFKKRLPGDYEIYARNHPDAVRSSPSAEKKEETE